MEHRRHSYHRKPRPKRPTKITIPLRAGPHVKLVFSEMKRQNVTYDEVEVGSGVLRTTLKAWRHKNKPGIETMEAALNFLGWDFVPIPRAKILPTALVEDLKPLAERHSASLEATIAAFMSIAARERGSVGEDILPFVGELRPYQVSETLADEVGEGKGLMSEAAPAFSRRPADIEGFLPCAA